MWLKYEPKRPRDTTYIIIFTKKWTNGCWNKVNIPPGNFVNIFALLGTHWNHIYAIITKMLSISWSLTMLLTTVARSQSRLPALRSLQSPPALRSAQARKATRPAPALRHRRRRNHGLHRRQNTTKFEFPAFFSAIPWLTWLAPENARSGNKI